MELSFHYHPSEIFRRIHVSCLEFLNDQDFRHPELRHRLGLELSFRAKQIEASEPLKELIDPILEEFDRSEERVPFIEFWVLLEWNERYQLASVLVDLMMLEQNLKSSEAPLMKAIHERLREIQNKLKSSQLDRDPSWIQLLTLRWHNTALRDELEYFRSLLK